MKNASMAHASRISRVLVSSVTVHRQHTVEAGNLLEVGDAQVNDEGFWLLNIFHPVGHGWLVVATRGGRSKKKIFLEETPGYARRPSFGVYMIHLYVFCLAFARRGSKRKKSVGHRGQIFGFGRVITAVMRLLCWLS